MVLLASDAANITDNSILIQNEQDLAREVFLTESRIRRAGRKQKRDTVYNAEILGNPFDDPSDDGNLTALQIEYRDTFVNAGYVVTLDPATGWWKFDWAEIGSEQLTTIYSIRTSVTPGAIDQDTIDLITEFFALQSPAVTTRVTIVTINGGDIDETEFGATASTFYEYHAAVNQEQQPDTDFSTDLTTYIEVQGAPLGYASGNVKAYRVSG